MNVNHKVIEIENDNTLLAYFSRPTDPEAEFLFQTRVAYSLHQRLRINPSEVSDLARRCILFFT